MLTVQTMTTGQLLEQYRDTLLALGKTPTDRALSRQADALEEEVSRRMAW